LLSLGIDVGYLPNIQAKFWVSDKWLAIPSGDFNRMNLGHQTSKQYWKADTQLLLVEDDREQITRMKELFEHNFKPIDRGSTCFKDVDTLFRRMSKHNNLAGSKGASKYLARFKSTLMIKTEQDVRLVVGFAVRLTELDNKKRVEGVHMLMAIILYHLQRREHRLEEIGEDLENIETEIEIKNAIDSLEKRGLVIRSGDVYRINPNFGDLKAITQKSIQEF
jgi:C4-dicarboxylate-specific signal transduction histidine kinase